MVGPLPYKSAAEFRVRINNIPIIFEVAGTVAHGVAIFTQYQRTGIFRVGKIVSAPLGRSIHPADHIRFRRQLRAFVMGRATGIPLPDPCNGVFNTVAIAGFVAHRPHHYTRAVFIPLYQADRAVTDCVVPLWVAGNQVILFYFVATVNGGNAVAF